MPRPQFTLRALLVLILAVACFFGGVRFEKERRRMADAREREAMSLLLVPRRSDLEWPSGSLNTLKKIGRQ